MSYVIANQNNFYFCQSDVRRPQFRPHVVVMRRGANRLQMPHDMVRYPDVTTAQTAINGLSNYLQTQLRVVPVR